METEDQPIQPEQTKVEKPLLKRIKKIAIITSIVFAVLLITGIILAYVYESEIKKFAIEEINKQLKAEVIIDEDDLSFSFIKNFPKASLTFHELLILEENKKDTLIFADNISLEFGIFSVISGDYVVNEIDVVNTNINLKTDINGQDNYIIWETTPDSISSSEDKFSFDLKELNFNDVAINYLDEKSQLKTNISFISTTFSGKFTDKKTHINLSSEHFINLLGQDSVSFFSEKNSTANLDIHLDNKTNTLEIKKGDVTIEKMELNVTGKYDLSSDRYNLKTNTKNLSISDIFSLLPNNIAKQLAEYKTDGVITGEGVLEKLPKASSPNIVANFSLEEGSLTESSTGAQISNLSFNGTYKLSPNTQHMELTNLSGDLSGGDFNGNIKIIGLNKMSVFSKFSANVDLKKLAEFLNFENIEHFEGQLVMNNNFTGTANKGRFNVSEFSGKTDVKNVSLKLAKNKYSLANLSGDFNFNKFTSAGTFKGDYGSSDFSISCQVKNLMQYMLNGDVLNVSTYIQSDQLVLDEVMMLASSQEQENVDDNIEKDTVFRLPQKVMTNVSANVGSLRYGKHEFNEFKGNVLFAPEKISSSNISFKANEGIYALSGVLQGQPNESFKLTADAICSEINIQDFFNRFDNFGQEILEARHIKGKTDATINLKADLTSALTINTKSLDVTTDFTISNGQLIGFEMFDEMAEYIKSNKIAKTFVKVDMLSQKLKHVYFNELTNQLTIKDEKLILPDMIIKSSAMDMGVYGVQSFSGNINYGVNFRLRDVLTKQKDSEFGYIRDDGSGTRMFISIEGTIDEPIYRLDKEGKKRYTKKKKLQEKNTLKSILKKEFGFFKKDTSVKDIPNNNNQNNNKPQFEIEWEEDDESSNNQTKKNHDLTSNNTQNKNTKKKKGWLHKLVNEDEEKSKTTFSIEE